MIYLFTLSPVKAVDVTMYIAAMFNDRTYKESKGKLQHCLISARGDSLSISVATHYKLWAGKAKWLLKNTIMYLSKK